MSWPAIKQGGTDGKHLEKALLDWKPVYIADLIKKLITKHYTISLFFIQLLCSIIFKNFNSLDSIL